MKLAAEVASRTRSSAFRRKSAASAALNCAADGASCRETERSLIPASPDLDLNETRFGRDVLFRKSTGAMTSNLTVPASLRASILPLVAFGTQRRAAVGRGSVFAAPIDFEVLTLLERAAVWH